MFCFCLACICVYPVAYRRRYADHCVLASSRLLKFKTWLLFFLFFLFNTYYLLSNENPLFVILSLVACFFTQSSILYYSFFPHFTLLFTSLSVLSLFDIFDSLSVHFHIFICLILLYGSLVLR